MKYVLTIAVLGSCLLAGCGKQNAPGQPVGPPVITSPESSGASPASGAQGSGGGGLLKPGGV